MVNLTQRDCLLSNISSLTRLCVSLGAIFQSSEYTVQDRMQFYNVPKPFKTKKALTHHTFDGGSEFGDVRVLFGQNVREHLQSSFKVSNFHRSACLLQQGNDLLVGAKGASHVLLDGLLEGLTKANNPCGSSCLTTSTSHHNSVPLHVFSSKELGRSNQSLGSGGK